MLSRPLGVDRAARRSAIPYLVLFVGVLTTAIVGYALRNSGQAKDRLRFDNAVERVAESISNRVDTYVALLRSGAGLFAASEDVSPREFEDFAARLDLPGHYPGIQGIGFAVRVDAGNLPAFLANARRLLKPDFRIWPDHPRDVYFPIVYLEPKDRRNLAAVGYDMFTEATRHAAMRKAAESGTAQASGKVTLVQEIDPQKQAGFLIYSPVYRSGVPIGAAGGVSALRGFIYSPLRAGDFLSSVFPSDEGLMVRIRVYDETVDPERLLYDTNPGDGEADSASYADTTAVTVAGRRWVAHVQTLPAFELSAETRILPWILLVGFMVTGLLTYGTWKEWRARALAEDAAAQLRQSEEALRASEARLRQLVEAERQATLEASAANQAKDEFLATLSHELRTPLNAILGWATMLQGGRLNSEQRTRAIDVIARNAQTQADLIEDLLDVSRIITGKMRIEMRPASLAGPVQAALDAVRPSAEAKGITIVRELDGEAPVIGDPDRLQQVAWNLLSNAIKFTPAGGRITVRLERLDHHVELRVTDTGAGIAPSFLPYVFERFRQHDSSTTRSHGGMGLGLAIVRHLVEAHGGSVRAESEGQGLGATFIVRLPLRHHHRPVEPRPAPGTDDALVQSELAGRQAIVVDDDADSRELLAGILEAGGVVVHTAASASEALGLLERQEADLLLADIGMPGTDGYGLLREVRAHTSERVRSVPAIAVTAYARREDRDLALQAGFQAYVAKPVDVTALRATIRRVVIGK